MQILADILIFVKRDLNTTHVQLSQFLRQLHDSLLFRAALLVLFSNNYMLKLFRENMSAWITPWPCDSALI